ncbi:GGDEF domain-containing protein [Salinimonas sp. HHU 13199]|uniref:diguanylate cyclase n=1 Tax=Salinimonas profundi TaxID=2729140 RepID=A0ABR8LJZ5_9ALTE|nr:GGDEF domain-containing protein [Salinimonas profundi]MBD3585411.1 GGDEF domain-containing protein [Salinimonas profundi]
MINKQLQVLKQQHALLAQFIIRLSVFYQGYSRAIDEELQTLRSHLGGAANFALAQVSINKLNTMLQEDGGVLRRFKADTLQSVEGAAKALLAFTGQDSANPLLINTISQARKPAESLYDVTQLCVQTITLYSQATNTLSAPVGVAVKNHQPNQLPSPQKLLLALQEELIQLLDSYQNRQPDNLELGKLKQKVTQGLSNEELLNVCLTLLRLIVKDSMQEAIISGKVIQSLHHSLGNLHQGLSQSIEQAHLSFSSREEDSRTVRKALIKLEREVAGSDSFSALKTQTQQQLKQVDNALQKREEKDRREQHALTEQLEQLKAQVAELESKTRYYRNRLARQVATSQTDPLTKLPNRQAYNEHLRRLLNDKGIAEQSLCLAVVDVDHFKSINDKFGHAAGDKTLQVIGSHLRQALDKNDFIARWSGEEFVLILPGLNAKSLKQKLERLRTRLTELPFKFKQDRLTVTASFGGTCIRHGEDPDAVFERADSLLYQAKRAGRNCVVTDKDDV